MIALHLVVLWLLFRVQPIAVTGARERALRAFVAWGLLVLLITETLSLFSAITLPGLAVAWGIVAIALILGIYRFGYGSAYPFRQSLRSIEIRPAFPVLLIFGVTAIIAVAAPPNNWDSMTYHLARVANWAQNGDVSFYPSHIVRQLLLSPWAEYAILNFQVLSQGSDRWANTLQWMSLGVCAVSVSLIIREFGYKAEVQYLGVIIAITAPMLILQSTSTQNDLVVAAWLSAFVFFVLHPVRNFWFAAACLGLALNSKTTGFMFATPFLFASWWTLRRSTGFRPATLRFLGMVGVAVMLNIPYLWRNHETFGYVTGEPSLFRKVNMQVHDPAHLISNVVRNMSLHWGFPIGRVTWRIETAITAAHSAVGLDASDARTSYTLFHVTAPSNHEDEAGNPLQFWLIAVACIVILATRRAPKPVRAYTWSLLAGFLVFCALLKWQIWGSRLQVPIFVLGSAVAAIGVHLLWQSRQAHRIIVAVLVIACTPWLFLNRTRPLLTIGWDPVKAGAQAGTPGSVLRNWLPSESVLAADRTRQRFVNRPELERAYDIGFARATDGGCRRIGLIMMQDSWEYPLHVLALRKQDAVSFRHIRVPNQSRTVARAEMPICAIIALDEPRAAEQLLSFQFGDSSFKLVWQDSVIQVYRNQ